MIQIEFNNFQKVNSFFVALSITLDSNSTTSCEKQTRAFFDALLRTQVSFELKHLNHTKET